MAELPQWLNKLLAKQQQIGLKAGSDNTWAVVWSSSFDDKEAERFSEKAMDEYLARVDSGAVALPDLLIWHTPELKIGKADYVARDGHYLVAGGDFDKTPLAQKARDYYRQHAKDIGASHGYTYDSAQRTNRTYGQFDTFEISLLPRVNAANDDTMLLGVKGYSGGNREAYYKHLVAMFGKEEADRILAENEKRGKDREATGAAYAKDGKPLDYKQFGRRQEKRIAEMYRKIKAYNPDLTDEGFVQAVTGVGIDTAERMIERSYGLYSSGKLKPARKEAPPAPAPKLTPQQLEEQAYKAAGYTRDSFWGGWVPPKVAVKSEPFVHHPFWRGLVPAKSLDPGKVSMRARMGKAAKDYPIAGMQLQDAIDAMQRALELPDAVVVQMIRQDGQQRTYDILKAAIEAQGGTIEFNLEVKP